MVSRTGLVTNRVIEVEEELTQDDLQACANYLNTHFAGLDLAAIRARLLELMREEKALYDSLLKKVVAVGGRAFADGRGAGPSTWMGRRTSSTGPEFEDIATNARALQDLRGEGPAGEDPERLPSGDGVRIIIGHENPDPDLRDLALVTASYPVDGETGWGLGVVGCTRMEYARMVALVEHVARAVDQTLKEPAAMSERSNGGDGRTRKTRTRPAEATRARPAWTRRRARRSTASRSRRCGASATSCGTSCCAGARSSRTTRSASSATAQQAGIDAKAGGAEGADPDPRQPRPRARGDAARRAACGRASS